MKFPHVPCRTFFLLDKFFTTLLAITRLLDFELTTLPTLVGSLLEIEKPLLVGACSVPPVCGPVRAKNLDQLYSYKMTRCTTR